jgi:hypothetical protein
MLVVSFVMLQYCMLFILRHHYHHVAIMELEFWSHTSISLVSGLPWVLVPFGV